MAVQLIENYLISLRHNFLIPFPLRENPISSIPVY
jgi:hypothetical protein